MTLAALPVRAQVTPAATRPVTAEPARDPSTPGVGVQRTMRLLATSTPEHRNRVRILFYGQSITQGPWVQPLLQDLREQYPHADIVAENRAIGGFAINLLARPAEHDVFPFYPDLMIFHVYGGEPEYEAFIADVRRRTTSEILIQGDHVTSLPKPDDSAEKRRGWDWHDQHNVTWLPMIASKYGCGYVNVWQRWQDALTREGTQPSAYLSDGVHHNDRGGRLLKEMIASHLVYDPAVPEDESIVRTLVVGDDLRWDGGTLRVEFEGNRVDVVTRKSGSGSADVRVDGKRPSEWPESYAFTRPQPSVWAGWPCVFRVDSQATRVAEEWKLTITGADAETGHCTFDVAGSVTGADGSGSTRERFVSKSGRVVIDPKDWWLKDPRQGHEATPAVGHVITWQCGMTGQDAYESPATLDAGTEHAVTVVQGIANGRHVLELSAREGTKPAIEAIRVYRPPVGAR